MKLLTITIPCYNSEKYMHKCIESLLPGGEDVEILIVDDGSTDGTAAIAERTELKQTGLGNLQRNSAAKCVAGRHFVSGFAD